MNSFIFNGFLKIFRIQVFSEHFWVAASENVEVKYAETTSYGPIFLVDQHFWSLEQIQVLINHILGNHYDFVTNLKYHAVSIRAWLDNIFIVIYMPINKKYLEKQIFLRYSTFATSNPYKIYFPMIYRFSRFGEKKNVLKKGLTSVSALVFSRDVSLNFFNR